MIMIHDLSQQNSLVHQILYELRNVNIQSNRPSFRYNMRKYGQICAYEISKLLDYESFLTETTLGEADVKKLSAPIVICPILRAGLTIHEGMLDFLPDAESGFISAYRKHDSAGNFEIKLSYLTCPDIDKKILILADPMLATGASIEQSLTELASYGTPLRIFIVSCIASKEGIDYIHKKYPKITIFVGAIDEELTAKSYIVPGLGDAGDLSYGPKLQD